MTIGHPRHARVYIRRDGVKLVVAIVHHNQDGVRFEAPGALALSSWDGSILGEAVKTALIQSATVPKDLRKVKVTDWPAMQVSGEPSVRAFEAAYISIDVSGANPANLVYVLEGLPDPTSDLRITASLSNNQSPEEYGRLLLRIYEACRDRRF